MNSLPAHGRQRGATLVVGLIMLALITLTVTTAFTLSTTNLKSVGNMQFRNEALAAANKAIEQVLSSPFTTAPSAEEINVDLNNDGNNDYIVQIIRPTCVRSQEVVTPATLGNESSADFDMPTVAPDYSTIWNIEARVTDTNSGTSVRVHQGVRVLRTALQKQTECP